MYKKEKIEEIALELSKYFEEKTGKKIEYDGTFDMGEVINFYGGDIAFADIYEDEFKLKAYIVNVKDNPKYSFRVIVDQKIKNDLLDNKNKNYGRWNVFILKYLWFVIARLEDMEQMDESDIIYPVESNEKMKVILEKIQKNKIDNKQYTLFGILFYDVYDKISLPVYKCDDKLYVQESNDNIINNFIEIMDEKLLSKIILLNNCFTRLVNVKEYYKVGDESLIVYSQNKDCHFIGNNVAFLEFIKNDKNINNEEQEKINVYRKKLGI